MELASLDTPVVAVDLDVFEANVALCFERLRGASVRPHMKTSKSPVVAARLLAAGAVGVCVAKVSEAEVMLAGGIDDLLITTEIAGVVKAARLARLIEAYPEARIRVVVDSVAGAAGVDAAVDRPVEALIEVNVGQNRAGVLPPDAAALARALATSCPRIRVIGVQGYEGHLQHVQDAAERRARCDTAMVQLGTAVAALREDGVRVDVVSTGGTGTAEFCAVHDVVTEVQPGSFIFMDAAYGAVAGVPYAPALNVIATVVSRPAPDRVVIDAGVKALSDDLGAALLVDAPGWVYQHAGDEHGVLTPAGDGERRELEAGDRVALVPSHIDTTVNLHDVLYAHRGRSVEETWPVAARGKVQ